MAVGPQKPINGTKGWIALFLTAILSGTGGGVLVPQLAPTLYRPHPFSSQDWEREDAKWQRRHIRLESRVAENLEQQEKWILQMQHEILAMTALVQTFAEFGPKAVREQLEKMEGSMRRYHEIAVTERAEIAKEQTKHGLNRGYQMYPRGYGR